jgi:hypothetical protein
MSARSWHRPSADEYHLTVPDPRRDDVEPSEAGVNPALSRNGDASIGQQADAMRTSPGA